MIDIVTERETPSEPSAPIAEALADLRASGVVAADDPKAVALVARHPRLAAAWVTTKPFVKFSLYGAAFVAGGLVLAKIFGPPAVRRLGEQGGEGFAEGALKVQEAARTAQAVATRGARWFGG